MNKILFLLTFAVLCLSGCEEDDTNQTLPPPTQTGKNILACKIDGKSFINKGAINCFYQNIDGEYYFGISGENDEIETMMVHLGTIKKTISENEIIILSEPVDGKAEGGVFFSLGSGIGDGAGTNSEYTGEMHITKFDTNKQIVSGTFWFDVKHPVTGKRVEVRDGRFDAQYGQ